MPEPLTQALSDADATAALGGSLARALEAVRPGGCCLWLEGELGTGKTTLVRGLLRALGHPGRVPSPSYTLVEPYELDKWQVYHIDLYRIEGGTEAAQLGLSELPGPGRLLLIEWPAHGGTAVPAADLRIGLSLKMPGRLAELRADSVTGARVLESFLS